jgi:hypothetical protein
VVHVPVKPREQQNRYCGDGTNNDSFFPGTFGINHGILIMPHSPAPGSNRKIPKSAERYARQVCTQPAVRYNPNECAIWLSVLALKLSAFICRL